MTKTANMPFYYPREAPNTSYFPQFIQGYWTWIGYGREEVWIDRESRRYEQSWHILRRILLVFYPIYYLFPFGFPLYFARSLWGEYGEKPALYTKPPHDGLYLEWGGNCTDAEFVRHIHSRTNM